MVVLNCHVTALQVDSIQSDALFILLVEKDAAFMRLAEDRFYNTYPCIILTAKGQPDVASRSATSVHTLSSGIDCSACIRGHTIVSLLDGELSTISCTSLLLSCAIGRLLLLLGSYILTVDISGGRRAFSPE